MLRQHPTRVRRLMLALTLILALAPLSFIFDDHGLQWAMWRDAPGIAIGCLIAAGAAFALWCAARAPEQGR